MRRVLRWLLRATAAVVVLVVLVVGFTAVRVWQVARLDSRDRVDAIVVLGASQFDGRPSAIFKARLDHAKTLYDDRVGPVVVTVGGNREGDRFTEAAAGARYLRSSGVPADAVAEVGKGSDTLSSLEAVAVLAEERSWENVLLVTDPWHSYRARSMAGEVGLSARTSPARTGPVVQGRGRELRYILRETAAYLYYKVLGTSSGGRGPSAV
ncbi:MAG TPA: YdcF family protein [Frankiaceae bacterium]|nr:YdcF family protein [Frankiaceae bacterium]